MKYSALPTTDALLDLSDSPGHRYFDPLVAPSPTSRSGIADSNKSLTILG